MKYHIGTKIIFKEYHATVIGYEHNSYMVQFSDMDEPISAHEDGVHRTIETYSATVIEPITIDEELFTL